MIRRVLLVASLLAGACGGRNLDAGPEPLVDDDDDDGLGGAGGLDGEGGMSAGGMGGAGTGGEGQGGSTPPPNPIDCLTCVATECPETVACLTDTTCVQGLVCTVSQCLSDGQPDLACVADCFDGDFDAALQAIQSISCVIGPCGDVCGDFLPF